MTDAKASRFVQLLIRYQNDLLRYIVPLVGNFDDAQDVLQETAKALWQKFDQYDTDQPFVLWARQFARNEVLMFHRRKNRFTFLSADLIDDLADRQQVRSQSDSRRREALDECLKKLSEADRRLIDRRYSHRGATVQQLAEETGRTANTLYKALGRIRQELIECVRRSLASEPV